MEITIMAEKKENYPMIKKYVLDIKISVVILRQVAYIKGVGGWGKGQGGLGAWPLLFPAIDIFIKCTYKKLNL